MTCRLEKCWPPDAVYSCIPWGDIDEEPSSFIDTTKFPIPDGPVDPRNIDVLCIFEWCKFYRDHSTARPLDPFVFRSKRGIQRLDVEADRMDMDGCEVGDKHSIGM